MESIRPTGPAFALRLACFAATLTSAAAWAQTAPATGETGETVVIQGRTYRLPTGYEMQLVAGPPLVDRPICADFDEQGRLYVANSSGTNDNVKTQLEERPHEILRLEDSDGDGRFDKRIVFADKMMFPEGTLWHDGSLYVAAPPSIWKLTDTDDDGRADKREEWFKGLTLTGCANDLHGPYLGPDGWIYWCKGAFAEQTHTLSSGEKLVTKASHIFRRRPEGGPLESVMAGGMDNPVELVFTPGGERIFTTTFLVHPGGGKRDGLIHAIYGGVYGKVHRVLDGHTRTGPTMPVLAHLGAAAPCGLASLEASASRGDTAATLLACSFNMHRITRHRLTAHGASYANQQDDFVASDDLDFHPTDVLEDADGSVLVVDTGGWYKLCCPTSQLWKPDVLGGIYRVQRKDAKRIKDPRGNALAWGAEVGVDQLSDRLSDRRFAVRSRAQRALRKRGADGVDSVLPLLKANDAGVRLAAVWTLCRIDADAARQGVRAALSDRDATVRQAAAHAASVWRDRGAGPALRNLLRTAKSSPHNIRAAAEALGRLGDASVTPDLLSAAAADHDRAVLHSLTYALIELGDINATREGLSASHPQTRQAALLALNEMSGTEVKPTDLIALFDAENEKLREAAWWLAERHPEWAGEFAGYFRRRLAATPDDAHRLADRLMLFSGDPAIQGVVAEVLTADKIADETRTALLKAVTDGPLRALPAPWVDPLGAMLENDATVSLAVAAIRKLAAQKPPEKLEKQLRELAARDDAEVLARLQALAALPKGRPLEKPAFGLVLENISSEQSVLGRALAVDVLLAARLNDDQWKALIEAIPGVGPLDLERVLTAFEKQKDPKLGIRLVGALRECPSLPALQPDRLRTRLAPFGKEVLAQAEPLFERIEQENREKFATMEKVLALVDQADIRRGQRIFQGAKVSCSACHAMGYLGGRVGPDMTRIGRIRSERDLLESVLFPSASFVRSYEPVAIVTAAGRVYNGVVKDETATELVLQVDAQKVEYIPLGDIEERRPSKISVMPAGLEKQLSPQDLADLIRFLKQAR